MVAIDGKERFVFHSQLPRGMQGSAAYARESIELAAGRQFPYEIIDIAEWTAGFTLVAERYGVGRIFIAGDAAHLFTPTAGQGYNTSVDDVANLGWKPAAVCQGWGGPALLSTYEIERKAIGYRNTRFARSIADFFSQLHLPETLEMDSGKGDAARAELGSRLQELAWREFDAPGIHFGTLRTLAGRHRTWRSACRRPAPLRAACAARRARAAPLARKRRRALRPLRTRLYPHESRPGREHCSA